MDGVLVLDAVSGLTLFQHAYTDHYGINTLGGKGPNVGSIQQLGSLLYALYLNAQGIGHDENGESTTESGCISGIDLGQQCLSFYEHPNSSILTCVFCQTAWGEGRCQCLAKEIGILFAAKYQKKLDQSGGNTFRKKSSSVLPLVGKALRTLLQAEVQKLPGRWEQRWNVTVSCICTWPLSWQVPVVPRKNRRKGKKGKSSRVAPSIAPGEREMEDTSSLPIQIIWGGTSYMAICGKIAGMYHTAGHLMDVVGEGSSVRTVEWVRVLHHCYLPLPLYLHLHLHLHL